VRHPEVSPTNDTYMLAAYTASFVGLFGRAPTMVSGAGKDDGGYYVRAANHYGVLGNDQCYAGWSGYWESWLATGHGDLALAETPARFLPNATPPIAPPVIPPPLSPPSVPEGVLVAKVDALAALVQELVRANGDAHAAINQNVTDGRAENRSFFASVAAHWKAITAFVAGPVATYVTCRATGKCRA